MKNLIKTIECTIHHCLYCFLSISIKQSKDTHLFLDTFSAQRNFILLLFILLLPLFSINAQNQKAIKDHLQEDKIYYTPQLKGLNPMIKPPIAGNSDAKERKELSTGLDLQSFKRSSSSATLPQLLAKINSEKQMSTEVPVYTGTADQRSPQIVSDGSGMYIVFENYDIVGGSYPYGSVDIYKSIDGGQVWNYWNSVSSTSFHLYLPQIVLVGSDLIVSYQRNGALRTFCFDPANEKLNPDIPVPVVSTSEYVVGHRMITDAQKYIGPSYLYMAILFKQADGKNKVLFSISTDTARTWQAYDSVGLSQSELNASSIGLDYSSSGLYLAYLGTNANAGSIILRKSISYGSSWSSEVLLPMNVYGGANKKVGPMVAAMGQRVSVIYQYDYAGDATDWKTGSDFDIYAIASDDGGGTWQERSVSSTFSDEILPSVTSDYDGNFYVSFIRDGKTRVSSAGSEFAFGYSDSSSSANVSLDDFPSIYGSPVSGTHTANITWTELSNSNGLDIYSASTALKIPPLTPSGLFATVISNSEIKLSWTDNSFDESGFVIYYRQTGTGSAFTQIATVSTNVTSYSVTGLTPIGYDFYVRAYNANGFSLRTNIVSATPSSGNAAPASPQNLTATSGSAQATLKWNKNTESDFLLYRIYGGVSPNPTTKIDSTSGGITDTVKVIAGLMNGTTYYFHITAVNNTEVESGISNEVNATPTAIVDNTPPIISVNSPTGTPVVVGANGQVGSSPQVSASASDAGSGILRMQVAYRNTSEQSWSYSQYVSAASISFSIPKSEFVYSNEPIGVNYRVGAWDNAGNVAWSPYNSIDVQLGPQATDQSNSMPAASQQSKNKALAYRLISVPYDLPDKKPVDLLSNFGNHSENNISYARWRFQRYVNGQYQDYDQFSTEDAVTPGAAFFFIVRDQGPSIIVKGASVVRSDVMYNTGISLQSGWNLVGNPFNIPYPIDSLEFYTLASSAPQPIRQRAYFTGAGSIGGWDTSSVSVNQIQPWSGIAVYVNSAGTLKFPSAGQSSGLPKTRRLSSIPQIEKETAGNWTIAVNAYRSDIDMRCEGITLGMAQGANEGDDPYDSYIPPIVGDKNVAVYFKNADGAMMHDIRPPNENGNVWEMRVVTGDAGANVKLTLGDRLNLPNPAFEAYLFDIDQKMAYNLQEVQSMEINSGNGMRNFRVVVGKKSFVEGNNAGIALMPTSMKLYANYPNPFNPETVIRYTVPGASASYTVTLKIFNVLGQEIATLVNEQKSSGYYEVKWNALRQSSGIYFYRLSVSDGSKTFQDTQKMVLMK
jgi:Fibronectin type III domain